MLKVKSPEVPPPGVALITETLAQPNVVSSDLSTVAVSWVSLTIVVGSAVAFQFTTDPLSKYCPFTVSVRVSEPDGAKAGDSEATLGTGLYSVPETTVVAVAWLFAVFGS